MPSHIHKLKKVNTNALLFMKERQRRRKRKRKRKRRKRGSTIWKNRNFIMIIFIALFSCCTTLIGLILISKFYLLEEIIDEVQEVIPPDIRRWKPPPWEDAVDYFEIDCDPSQNPRNHTLGKDRIPGRVMNGQEFFIATYPLNCDDIPKPLCFPIEGRKGGSKSLVSYRNMKEQMNYELMKERCEILCEQKEIPPHDTDIVKVYANGLQSGEPFNQKMLDLCPDVKMLRVKTPEDAHVITTGWDDTSSLLEEYPDKMVVWIQRETMYDNPLKRDRKFRWPNIMNFNPYSTVLHLYQSLDSYWTTWSCFREKYTRDYGKTWDFSTYKDDLMKNIEEKSSEYLAATFVSECGYRIPDDKRYFRKQYLKRIGDLIPMKYYGKCGRYRFPEPKRNSYLNTIQHGFSMNPDGILPSYPLFNELFNPRNDSALRYMKRNMKRELGKMVGFNDVKFSLCFENTLSYGYMSEKLAQALLSPYTVPVYYGAPNVFAMFDEELIRKYKWFVYANDYPDPDDLVEYLKYLDGNMTAYMEYFQGRLDGYELVNSKYLLDNVWVSVEDKDGNFNGLGCKLGRIYKNGKVFCE